MKKFKIVVLSGAGISQESGVETFRDGNGLWEQHKIEDVATPNALKNNTKVFIDFYNMRKNHMKNVIPNAAHHIVKQLEDNFEVTVVTQNIDDLHEKAGSTNVLHMHGEISKMRSSFDKSYVQDYIEDIKVGDLCPDGSQMRPDVVLFGESLPHAEYSKAIEAFTNADIVIIIGTSLKVMPVAGLPWVSRETALIYYIDPADMDIAIVPKLKRPFFYHIQQKASVGTLFVKNDIEQIYL